MKLAGKILPRINSRNICWRRRRGWILIGFVPMPRTRWTKLRSVTSAGLMDFIETNEYFGSWAPGTPVEVAKHLDKIHAAFPGKPVVISEYGYCACTEDRPEGDGHRIEILQSHDAVFRSRDFVAGAIFFCYNDYRTHVGYSGVGALKQNVHGVVNLLRRAKSFLRCLAPGIESGRIR